MSRWFMTNPEILTSRYFETSDADRDDGRCGETVVIVIPLRVSETENLKNEHNVKQVVKARLSSRSTRQIELLRALYE